MDHRRLADPESKVGLLLRALGLFERVEHLVDLAMVLLEQGEGGFFTIDPLVQVVPKGGSEFACGRQGRCFSAWYTPLRDVRMRCDRPILMLPRHREFARRLFDALARELNGTIEIAFTRE